MAYLEVAHLVTATLPAEMLNALWKWMRKTSVTFLWWFWWGIRYFFQVTCVIWWHITITVVAVNDPGFPNWRDDKRFQSWQDCVSQLFCGRIWTFVCFTYVDLQTIFGFEVIITLAALKSLLRLAGWFRVSWMFLFFSFFFSFQVVFFPLQVSSQGWWTLFLLLCFQWSGLLPGVQREGEWGANSDVECERMALACQCLAVFQALSGQWRETFNHLHRLEWYLWSLGSCESHKGKGSHNIWKIGITFQRWLSPCVKPLLKSGNPLRTGKYWH